MRFFIIRIIFSDTRVDDEYRFTRSYAVSAPTPADAVNLLAKDWMSNVEAVDYVEIPSDSMGYTPIDAARPA